MQRKKLLSDNLPIFITGTGTDVGKTIVSSILCEWLKADYWKPIQSGDPKGGDRITIESLVRHTGFTAHPESFKFQAPLSPHAAAKMEQVSINLNTIKIPDTNRPLIIEGAGGLLVPINYENQTICDLIIHLGAKTIVVVKEYLGNINHTLLTIEHLKRNHVKIAGLVFVGEELPHTWEIVSEATGLPLLFRVPMFPSIDSNTILNFANKIS